METELAAVDTVVQVEVEVVGIAVQEAVRMSRALLEMQNPAVVAFRWMLLHEQVHATEDTADCSELQHLSGSPMVGHFGLEMLHLGW